MPLLDRLQGASSDDEDKNKAEPTAQEPQILRGRAGYARFSMAALEERIRLQVEEELGDRADLLRGGSVEDRRRLVREAGEYVLAVASVALARDEREALFDAVYRQVFGWGILDDLLADEAITQVLIEGADHVYVRLGAGDPARVDRAFEDEGKLWRLILRMVALSGGGHSETEAVIEVGIQLHGRPARLSAVFPPLNPFPQVDLRLHSREIATLAGWTARGGLTGEDGMLLEALAQSPHGLLIAGDHGAGKTSLLEALLPVLPRPSATWVVQRAAELRVPEGMRQASVQPGQDFEALIQNAMKGGAGALVLDELRGDESVALGRALESPRKTRLLTVLRSDLAPDRLYSALSVLLRKARPGISTEALSAVLLERLPFVAGLVKDNQTLRLGSVSEWQEDGSAGRVRLIPLVADGRAVGHQPVHALDLPPEFWRGGSGQDRAGG